MYGQQRVCSLFLGSIHLLGCIFYLYVIDNSNLYPNKMYQELAHYAYKMVVKDNMNIEQGRGKR